MPRKSTDKTLRDVPHDEEKRARAEWLNDLKKRGWKKAEIEAAESGWEYAFDTGFEYPDADADAAGDLADCIIDGSRRRSREAVADDVYTGICAARRLQRSPDPNQAAELQASITEIKEATGPVGNE